MPDLSQLDTINLELLQLICEQQSATIRSLANSYPLSRQSIYARCRTLVSLGHLVVENGGQGRTHRYSLAGVTSEQVRSEIERRLFAPLTWSPTEAQKLAQELLGSVVQLSKLLGQAKSSLDTLVVKLKAFSKKRG